MSEKIRHNLKNSLILLVTLLFLCFSACTTGTPREEESATQFTKTDIYNEVRNGAHLILKYNSATQTFTGTLENTTDTRLRQVRVEVHLSNGTELGPTTPRDLAPGQTITVILAATGQDFVTWNAHPEVGVGEHGPDSERGSEARRSSSRTERSGEHGGSGEGGSERSGEQHDSGDRD